MRRNYLFPDRKCVYTGIVTGFAVVGLFLQDGAQEEERSRTQQESAWLFRLWYTFDHKYPFYTRLYTIRALRQL